MLSSLDARHPRLVAFADIAGFVAMILGAADPLEGSIVVVFGSSLLTWAAWIRQSPRRKRLLWSFGAVASGVAALWIMSAFGGIGGSTGRSMWWALILLPYPIGWMLGLVEGYRHLREHARG